MKKLFKNKKGFTLMEMLIVVAIIVILVAISMPVFSKQLSKAKEATDQANERAAKAVATATYLADPDYIEEGVSYYYDIEKGELISSKTQAAYEIKAYGKAKGNESNVIKVDVDSAGAVTISWVKGK